MSVTFRDKESNIQFTVNSGKITKAGKYGLTANGDFTDAEIDGVKPFVNAVEIDWNGAIIGES